MPTGTVPQRPLNEAHVLDFARAFRTAARAVGFYPATHQAVVAALEKVVSASRAASASGPLCLTILPGAFLAGGVPIDSTESVVGELAGILHRHGVGAMSLDGRASTESWRALFALLARKPEDLRAAGGIQRQWKTLHHSSPAILEVDFGALLRGQVGGDFDELAGIISHYLETAGVGASLLDDPCGALKRAIDSAPDDAHAVAALLRELRAAAQLTWATAPQQFDDVFRRASTIGEHLTVGLMGGLLDQRGTHEATLGTLDLVTALVERMSDTTLSRFLVKALGSDDATSPRFSEVMTTLLPESGRRRRVVVAAQGVAFEAGGVLEKWDELEHNLDDYLDSRFVPDQYARELHSAKSRTAEVPLHTPDPPERLNGWLRSIDDAAVEALDVQMLLDLARVETEPSRALAVVELLRGHVTEAVGAGQWLDAARLAEAIRLVASDPDNPSRRSVGTDALQRLGASSFIDEALARVAGTSNQRDEATDRLLVAIGPGLVPALVRRWSAESERQVRQRLEALIGEFGDAGRKALRRVLSTEKDTPALRVAALRLLLITGSSEQASVFESCLADPDPDVRREAFQALAAVPTDRARDAIASGIAGADPGNQLALVEQVAAMRPEQAVPTLVRLLVRLDQTTAPNAYGAVIAALGKAGSDEAARGLLLVFDQTRWRAPVRAMRFRMKAWSALRAVGGPWPAAGLRRLLGIGRTSSRSTTVASSPKAGGSGRTGTPT